MTLYRDVQPGDTLRIGDTVIAIEQKSGQRTRMRIDSPLEVEHLKAGARPTMTRPDVQPSRPPAPAAPPPPTEEPARRPRLTLPPMHAAVPA